LKADNQKIIQCEVYNAKPWFQAPVLFTINGLDIQAEDAAPRVQAEDAAPRVEGAEAAAAMVAIPEIEKAASASGKASSRKRGRPRAGPFYTTEEKLVRTLTK
jgi:hypothetical protein